MEIGRYENADEVVRDGLRLLERMLREEALKLNGLRRAAEVGFGAIDQGESVSFGIDEIDGVIARLAERAMSRTLLDI